MLVQEEKEGISRILPGSVACRYLAREMSGDCFYSMCRHGFNPFAYAKAAKQILRTGKGWNHCRSHPLPADHGRLETGPCRT